MKGIWQASALLAAGALSQGCLAWDGVVSGTISRIDSVAGEPGNYETRILMNGQTFCSATGVIDGGWGYLNSSDANYKGTLAMLMLAYSTGKAVTIYSLKEGAGYCHIHYVMVAG